MATLSVRARALISSPHGRRLIKFAAVSVISTIVTQVTLFLCYDVVSIGTAMECNVIATAVSTVPAYWLNRTWTWGKRGKSDPWREIAPFWIIAFVGLVLSTIAVGLAAHNADSISHAQVIRKIFVQFANLFTYGLIWVGRYAIFNKYMFGSATIRSDETLAPEQAAPGLAVATTVAASSDAGGMHVPGEVEAIVVEERQSHGDAAARTY